MNGIALLAGLLVAGPTQAQPPDNSWHVWMKVSPCAETLVDWMTVAHNNPSAGGTAYELARALGGSGAVTFPGTPAGFTAAHLMADTLRLVGFLTPGDTTQQAAYNDYCCKGWSVWSRTEGGVKTFATVNGLGTPGPNFPFQERSNLCCEQAAAAAGGKGACAFFRLSNGKVVHFTPTGPQSVGGSLMINGVMLPAAKNLPCNVQRPLLKAGDNVRATMAVGTSFPCEVPFNRSDSTFAVITPPSHGVVTVSNGAAVYKSSDGYTGTDSFTLLRRWPEGGTAVVTFAVSVRD